MTAQFSDSVETISSNGIALAYQEYGSGSPLILINGFASTMDMWNPPVIDELARHFRVIIFDNRGTGYSTATEEPFTIPLFAGDTIALMDALGIAKAHILGHSMGASITQELVLGYPERVERLVIVAGTCGGDKIVRMEPETWATLTDKSGSPLDLANRMFSVLFPKEWLAAHDPWQYCPEVKETTSEESAARQAETFFSWPGTYDRLPQIRTPALVITGTEDAIIPPANAKFLAQRIPGARFVEFPGAGHGLMYQCPEEFTKTVLKFLKSR